MRLRAVHGNSIPHAGGGIADGIVGAFVVDDWREACSSPVLGSQRAGDLRGTRIRPSYLPVVVVLRDFANSINGATA